MRAECIKMQEQIIALGAKGASSNMEVRRHTKSCSLCKEFILSLSQLEQTEHDLEHHEAPQDIVGGTLAKVLGEARERKHQADSLRISARAPIGMLRGVWRKLFGGR
ncbi:MAG: hypothetical protein EBZ48_07165 [Proteobacteria bacterium]|nr:hypothetical protein [Pseudomonadota bacterium]